ncbi:MAG: translation elongation factor 4 [bacterium]|nr:translation elongation factor 4 [bacterium]
MSEKTSLIRNFLITAHIDHGKSTLADRLLEATGTVEKRLMKPQYLDQLELERERGITIKMAPVRMQYKHNNEIYTLNLIDTPGHADFAYEVSRALEAVEGAVLLVDATQGIQAQTLANFENARKTGLVIIGAVNKIDVAQPDQIQDTILDLADLIGCTPEEILKVSGKTGEGAPQLLERIVAEVPPPSESKSTIGRALIFDSFYDEHKGIMAFVRIIDGKFDINQDIELLATRSKAKAKEIGFFAPDLTPGVGIEAGNIGYIATGLKDPDKLKIGDTITGGPGVVPLPGYLEPRPVVFVSFYPENSNQYDEFKQALGKLRLTDSALVFEPDASELLGRGFKGGFLGRLHFEITAERLVREFKIETVNSFPSVAYRVDGVLITNPKDFPSDYKIVEEPMTRVEIVTPPEYLGAILQLKESFRFSDLITGTRKNKIVINTSLPLSDLIRDLDDRLKSVSQGFASFHYEIIGYARGDVAKLEILVAGNAVPGLIRILPKKDIEYEARRTVEKLKELLPRQQFVQAIQTVSGGRIVARENIAALKKDVAGYLYGGDRTRKMKLWKKQQRGKKRLKEAATQTKIKIPADVFKELLKK